MKRRKFDPAFKEMAVELSYAKGSVQEAARELGIDSSRITKWRQQKAQSGSTYKAAGMLTEEQKQIRQLQKELKEALLDRTAEAARYIKKGSQHLLQGRRSDRRAEIFQFISQYAHQFPVEKMCNVLNVSSSGYYYWRNHQVSSRQRKQTELLHHIQSIYQNSASRYGSPRIAHELKDCGVKASRNRVARVMRKAKIKSIICKKHRVQTTDSEHTFPTAANVLNREFTASQVGQKWVSDITYIRTGEGWLYLTVILDLADRKVVGWSLSDVLKATHTSVAAWKMALKNRSISQKLLFHSDRGIQYACPEFRTQFNGLLVQQSMSRKGNCWDNAVAESFFKTLKTELVYHRKFATRLDAKLALFEYIEGWYNRKRKHAALGYLSPSQYERLLWKNRIAA